MLTFNEPLNYFNLVIVTMQEFVMVKHLIIYYLLTLIQGYKEQFVSSDKQVKVK